jgi:2-aminoethylphosphonate-pyruvate transaminase
MDDDIPYLLLTPGPLTTSAGVRQAMQRDYSTWDVDYNEIVNSIRRQLVMLATDQDDCSSVLMQGSGTFSVEATIGSAVPDEGELLVINNGAYGARMATIAQRLQIPYQQLSCGELRPPTAAEVDSWLAENPQVTHVAMVHCETTTGMLNPVEEVGQVVKQHGCCYIVDAMSSFGGIPLSMDEAHADFLISSANKCIQGVPGFGFVVARRSLLEELQGRSRSLSLDLFDQWQDMEQQGGKWRFTSPTHSVCAFATALDELQAEGGVAARHQRYSDNQVLLVERMRALGLHSLLPSQWHSPIITSFYDPCPDFDFGRFYELLKQRRYVIYPGKVTDAQTFRIGTIGHLFAEDIIGLAEAMAEVLELMQIEPGVWWEAEQP